MKELSIQALELTPTLVARDEELETLRQRLRGAIEGTGSTVLISGEAGIGKTRLAAELMRYAESLKVRVLFGRAVPHNLTPYLVFVDAFEELFEADAEDTQSKTLIKIDPSRELGIKDWILGQKTSKQYQEIELEPEAKRGRLFESVAHLLLKISKRRPILIVLDDLQWADSASSGLLHYLARNISSTRALIVGTCRSEELEAAEAESAFLDTLRILRKEGLIEEITLGRLKAQEVAELVVASLQDNAPEELAEGLYRDTEGNPFFAIEALKLLIQEGILVKRADSWRLERPIEALKIPDRVHEVLVRRLGRLPPSERRVLECASVVGDQFDSYLLEKILKMDRSRLLRRLGNLEKKHQLIHYAKEGYRFDHSKIREVLYQELGDELRQQYHLETAQALRGLFAGTPAEPHSTIAYHFMKGGFKEEAAHYYRKAAEDLSARGEIASAAAEIAYALEVLGDLQNAERGWLEAASSDIAASVEDWKDAQNHGQAALKIFRTLGDDPGEAIALQKLGRIEIDSPNGDPLRAEQLLLTALDKSRTGSDVGFAAGVHTMLARLFAYRLGDIERAMNHIAAIEGMKGALQDPYRQRAFLTLKGWINIKVRGDYSTGETDFIESMMLSRKLHYADGVAVAKYGLASAAYYRGRYDEARQGFEQFATTMKSKGFFGYAVESTCMAAECCLLQGDSDSFQRVIADLDDEKISTGVLARLVMTKPLRAFDLLLRGSLDGAREVLSQALKLAQNEPDIEEVAHLYSDYGIFLKVTGQNHEAGQKMRHAENLLRNYRRDGILANLASREVLLAETLQRYSIVS